MEKKSCIWEKKKKKIKTHGFCVLYELSLAISPENTVVEGSS